MGLWGVPIVTTVTPTSPVDNDRSTFETVQQMIALARDAASKPAINHVVSSLLLSLSKKNPSDMDLVRAIYWWVKGRVRFREDESILVEDMGWVDPYQELLISPEILIRMSQPEGDCDDFSMLLASLLVAAKIPVWFVAVAVDEREPWRWSHIYCKVFLKDERKLITLDASHGTYPGWETSREKFRVGEWRVN